MTKGSLTEAGVDAQAIERLAFRINEVCQAATLDLAITVGKLIIDHLYGGSLDGWQSEGPASASYRALAARTDLTLSPSALCRSVGVYTLVERLGGRHRWRRLMVSHFQEVLALAPAQQERLLELAENQGWTVAQLRSEVLPLRRRAPGQRALPLLRSIRRLRLEVASQLQAMNHGAAFSSREARELTEAIDCLREELGMLHSAATTRRSS